ncbi:hypothetical protein BZA70DRAFT_255441 [Myxozyma melibiosi]|uniref:DUF155 domain-containing protein n=1 Tax=Myxozyma melibiosi TaxID=54550 RepID=A0ABR1FAC2_9ASCO
MQSRLPQRNPRLMIQASRTSKPRRRIVSGYTAYHDDEEDEDEDDEDGNNGTSSGYGRRYDLDGGNANSGSDSSDDSGSGSDDESMIGDEDYEEAQRRPGRRVVYLPPVPEPAGHYNELHPTVAGTRRVTAYHIAEEFDLRQINKFAMQTHDVVDSLGFEGNGDDDALYLSYGLPMVPGKDGYRVRSGRREAYFPLAAATKAVGYFGGSGKRAADASGGVSAVNDEREMEPTSAVDDDSKALLRPGPETTEFSSEQQEQEQQEQQEQQQYSREVDHDDYFGDDHHSDDGNEDYAEHMYNESTQRAELFLFGYGVVVFWNFTETQERDIMADFMFSNHDATAFGGNLMSRILPEHDRETETFRFEYTMNENSRIFNDLIILRAHRSNKLNVKSKLTMSHAIAQSTILSYFETKMETVTIRELEIVPARLALLGTTPRLTREDLLKIEGKLFGLRVEVNLSSSVLDVPTFFWETEPGMQEFYDMVREYLEIKPRIKILNKRCQVFLDLADILGDSIAERNMSRITWIIIVLIVVSLCVTTLEIIMRFSVLSKLQPVPIDDDGASSAAINATADSPHAYLA